MTGSCPQSHSSSPSPSYLGSGTLLLLHKLRPIKQILAHGQPKLCKVWASARITPRKFPRSPVPTAALPPLFLLVIGFWMAGRRSVKPGGWHGSGRIHLSKVPTLRRKQVWLIASRDAYLVHRPQCLLRFLRSVYASEQMSPW